MVRSMLSGPEISPRSGNSPKNLVIFLHGVGADGANIADICHMLNRCIPDTYFLCPNAPFAYDMGFGGYQWFSLQDRSDSAMLNGVNKALPIVNEYIDYNLQRFNLSDNNLAIIGFSQGCMMALHLGIRRPKAPACVIGFSGRLIGTDFLKAQKINKPPITLAHGDIDPIVDSSSMVEAVKTLSDMGVRVDSHLYQGLAHGMNEKCLELAVAKLKQNLLY